MQTNPLQDSRPLPPFDLPFANAIRRTRIVATQGGICLHDDGFAHAAPPQCGSIYNSPMQKKIFWATFAVLGLIADFALPLWWALFATIPIGYISWWFAYRSDWF
jgi:hypothetical protein